MVAIKLLVKSESVWGKPNMRLWIPEDPSRIAEEVMIDIGPRDKKWANTFTLRLATPQGLEELTARGGILATRPLLVMKRYDFGDFWRWLEVTVASCESNEWSTCVTRLRRFFDWEYDGMEHRSPG